jgi:hypothetical protein
MNRSLLLSFLSTLPLATAGLPAQQGSVVLPPGYDLTEAPGSTAYGWGQGTVERRVQWIYDSSYFTSQGVDHPIVITRLRWRANGASTVRAGTYSQATLTLASATSDCLAPSATFATNLAADATLVHSGPVQVAAGAGETPNNWYVDLPLQTPFYYDPRLGADLVTDISVPPGTLSGSTAIHDAVFGGILGGRVVTTNHLAPTGTTSSGGLIVLEFGFDYPPGVSHGIPSGTGCGAGFPASFYELFDANRVNDLSNFGGLSAFWTGTGYVVTPGASAIVTPSGQSNLRHGDDTTTQVSLPWTLAYQGGNTNDLWVCSNGWVALEATSSTAYVESVRELLDGPARIAPLWDDLDPSAGGGVHAEVDPSNPGLFHVTWDQVPEIGAAGSPNTFQVSFQQGGNFEIKWGNVGIADGLAGCSGGGGAADPGTTDISALRTPILLGDDRGPLRLSPGARPVIGRTGSVTTRGIPPNSPVGFHLIGLTALPAPGIDLGLLGAPGCFQYVPGDVTVTFLPTGSSETLSLAVPNLPGLNGSVLHFQTVQVAPGINPFGLITSNAVEWRIHTL